MIDPIVIVVGIVALIFGGDVVRNWLKNRKLEQEIIAPTSEAHTGSLQAVHKPDMEILQKLPIAPSPEEYMTDVEIEKLDLGQELPEIDFEELVEDLVHEGEELVAIVPSAEKAFSVDDANDLVSKWLARSHANPMVETAKEGYAIGITECIQDLLALVGQEKDE